MPYTVTRQLQWPDGTAVVEVSSGGTDYTNPDALVAKYTGEFQTYDDPIEAAQTAIEICRQWRQDGKRQAKVAHGATGGMTMPFDPCSFKDLMDWADKTKERLPKCARCGDILGKTTYPHPLLDEEKFCSAYCAEEEAKCGAEM